MVLTIGADPEFLVYRDGQKVSANSVLPSSTRAEIGTDGCSSTGELRPAATKDPLQLVENVSILLNKLNAYHLNGEYEIVAGNGSRNNTTGGHIHFGMRKSVGLIRLFDWVSIYLQPLEPKASAKSRRRSYGELGTTGGEFNLSGVRDQPWGFEYRTPCSWITTPEIAKGMLAIYFVIADHYKTYPNFATMPEITYDMDYKFRNYEKIEGADAILAVIRSCRKYRKYRTEIEAVISKVGRRPAWTEEFNILPAWGINCVSGEYQVFTFNTDDFALDEFARVCNIISNKRAKRNSIRVYGAAEERTEDLVVRGPKWFCAFVWDNLPVEMQQKAKFEQTVSTNLAIGVNKRLRMADKRVATMEVVKAIGAKYATSPSGCFAIKTKTLKAFSTAMVGNVNSVGSI